jgi:bifunctional enzyme CysN/CysC
MWSIVKLKRCSAHSSRLRVKLPKLSLLAMSITLVGRLLYETNALMEGKVAALQAMAERRGMPFEWAFLLDAFQAERDQGITIDTAQVWFKSPKRDYVLIDAPGHSEFLKNMITGAAQASVALLLVDAAEGVQEQTRRHVQLLALLDIKQIIVIINKMDLIAYDEARFGALAAACQQHMATLGLIPQAVVPIAARAGDNLTHLSPHMPWYQGQPLLALLDTLPLQASTRALKPLRFPIQDVYKFDERRILAGRIEQGQLSVGDVLRFWPTGAQARVKSIEVWQARQSNQAQAGQSVGITLDQPLFIERGSVATHATAQDPPIEAEEIGVRLFWLASTTLQVGARYWLVVGTQRVMAHVTRIGRPLDAEHLLSPDAEHLPTVDAGHLALEEKTANDSLKRNQIADVWLRVPEKVVVDASAEAALGRVVLIEGYRIVAGGRVQEAYAQSQTKPRSDNLVPIAAAISAPQWARRNGHRAGVVWLTGLSGSGKSTLALGAQRQLFQRGWQVALLDGDTLRTGLSADLGFSKADRARQALRTAHAAVLMAQNGQLVLVALISPTREDRARVRALVEEQLGEDAFMEVYLSADLTCCEARDPKGFYAKARAGALAEFTGISAPYEPPIAPELVVDTSQAPSAHAIRTLTQALSAQFGWRESEDAAL